MQMVTREVFARGNVPPQLTEACVASLDREYIKRGDKLHHVVGTLMSGHRATTFFNSVLNAAYLRCAVGESTYKRMYALHTGDDVYARVSTLHDVEALLIGAASRGCRLNPSKQSIGISHAEFLRCAFAPEGAYGYVARAIATCASGSWTHSAPLDAQEALTNAVTVSRALINRSGQHAFPRLLGPALRLPQGVTVRVAIDALIGGRASFNGMPAYTDSSPIPVYELRRQYAKPRLKDWEKLPRNATLQYLSQHASEVEIEALSLTRTDPQPLMVASSYPMGQTEGTTVPCESELVVAGYFRPNRRGLATAAGVATRHEGALNKYPLIHLIADRLTAENLEWLLRIVGAPRTRDVYADAFGEQVHPATIHGTLPISDASSIARTTGYDLIYVNYPINL
jgi:hypothetical protein